MISLERVGASGVGRRARPGWTRPARLVKRSVRCARRRWPGYALALGLTLAVAAICVALDGVLVRDAPMLLFLLGVTLSAWQGGLGPGLIATLAGALAADYLLIEPVGAIAVAQQSDLVQLIVFVVVGLVISVVNEQRQRAQRTAQSERARLRDEMDDRSRTEAEIREREARLQLALDAAELGWWHLDLRTGESLWSPRLAAIFGLPAVETPDIRKQWLAQLHPEDRARVTTLFQDAMAGRAEYDIEYRVMLADASVRWLASRARLITDRRGKPALLTGVSADITQRKQAQEALRRSAERLERALTAARMVAWEWRLADGTGEVFGDTSLWGSPTPPRTRQEVWEMLHPDDRPRVQAMMSEAIAQRRPYVLRYRSLRPDASAALWLEAHGTVVCDGAGEPTSLAGVTFDINERMRAEQELKRALAILQAVSLSTPNTIAVKDRQSRVLMANPGMLRMLAKSEAEVLGKTNIEFLGPERGAAIVANDQRVMETGVTETFEELVPGAEGLRVFLSTKSPLRDEQGRVTGMVVLGTDVTERKRIEEALRQADRRKDEFLATLAHELRNPLAPLRNGLEIMRIARGDDSVVEQARHMMERQLGQMVRLIDDLLDLSRITLGKVELRLERVALASVVQSALETSRAPVEAGGHRLTVTLPPEPVHLLADATRLAQVLANLLNNSAKYTEPGGQIWLSAQLEGERVVLRVRDTGVGIPAHLLPAVFDLFVQADRSLERAQGGLGVGLTLVKRLVEMHGGTVEAHSAGPGQGSEFVVRLPALLTAAAKRHESRDLGGARATHGAPRRILVADDNEDAAASMAMMLSLLGHEVRTVHDGAAAVEAVAEFRPDIALLDIGMPRLDGLEAARRIRARPGSTQLVLVALTGWSQPEDRQRSQEAGFDHHLVKPADMAQLSALLDAPHP